MKSFVSFFIEPHILKKFQDKVAEENLNVDNVIKSLMIDYVGSKNNPPVIGIPYFAKANKGIPLWAMKSNQNNHKVIRAYFKALKRTGEPVSLNEMLYYCTHAEYQDTYIPPTAQNSSEKRFWNTYNQLKVDSPNSNGKVFEDHDAYDKMGRFLKVITVCSQVRNTLTEYKLYFGG